MSIADKFSKFCKALEFSKDEKDKMQGRFNAISTRLNKDFWGYDSAHGGKFVGSIGRETANSWESDIDMLYELPWTLHSQYSGYIYNGQSALLQAVKASIGKTYSNTDVGGDGQIVKVPFSDGMYFEVLPAFKNNNGTYTYPDSNGGGSWRTTNPDAEIKAISLGQELTNSNLKNLCKMLRAWKSCNSVPMGGLLIDTFAYNFLTNWANKEQSYLYYDFMTRDFFNYLRNTHSFSTSWYAVGSGALIYKKGDFISKAEKAYNHALEAIKYEDNGMPIMADTTWKEIYGSRFKI